MNLLKIDPAVLDASIVRFFRKVNRAGPIPKLHPHLGPCWLWVAGKGTRGYGVFAFTGRVVRSHQFSFWVYHGEVPKGKEIDHICRMHNCVNPDHLRAVPHRVNMIENSTAVVALNAQKTHCKHGHILAGDNLLIVPTRYGTIGRACRACRTKLLRDWHAAHYTHKGNFEANKTHCEHGHPLSGDNITIRHHADGRTSRRCMACAKASEKKRVRDPIERAAYLKAYHARRKKAALPPVI